MWEAQTVEVDGGQRFQIFRDGTAISFEELFGLLEDGGELPTWYTSILANCSFESFFWEHPPLTRQTFESPAEFILVDGPSLARLRPDPEPFHPQFERAQADVATFSNLGGDAVLIVPCPLGPSSAYPHLAAFLRGGPSRQIAQLWQAAGRTLRENLSTKPIWLSTAGMGVSWLHLRIDSNPKYYRFEPYKTASPPARDHC